MEENSRAVNRSRFQSLSGNKFFATTGISGFSQIHHARRLPEVIFWYLVIAGFSALTIRNLCILVDQYQHQEPVTTVTLATGEGRAVVDPARMEFCFRIILPEFHTELVNSDPPFTSKRNTQYDYEQPYNGSLAEDVGEALAKLDSKETIYNESQRQDSSWDYVIMNLLTRHFTVILTCQEYIEKCTMTDYWGDKPLGFRNNSDAVIVRQQIGRVLDHFRQLNISDLELLHLFSFQIQTLFQFSYYYTDSEGFHSLSSNGVQIRRIESFGAFQIFASNYALLELVQIRLQSSRV